MTAPVMDINAVIKEAAAAALPAPTPEVEAPEEQAEASETPVEDSAEDAVDADASDAPDDEPMESNAITLPARTPSIAPTDRSMSSGKTLRPPTMITSLIRPHSTSSPSSR